MLFSGHLDQPRSGNHSTRKSLLREGQTLQHRIIEDCCEGILQCTCFLNVFSDRINRTTGLHTEDHTKFMLLGIRRHFSACHHTTQPELVSLDKDLVVDEFSMEMIDL